MNISNYFERLGIQASADADLRLLNTIQQAHLFAVPFENLDIHYGVPILLDIDRFYDKIIRRKRGGFCYEINGLLSWLLTELGFDVTIIAAGVHKEQERFGPMKEHLALLVQLEDQAYLVDAGFGRFSMHPLPIVYDRSVSDPLGTYKFERQADERIVLSSLQDSGWVPGYIFSKAPRVLDDFKERCHFQQTSSESHFTKQKMITTLNPAGRVTLHENKLIITLQNERKETPVNDSKHFEQLLIQYFGTSFLP